MSRICRKFIVHGFVQGVGYRFFAYKSAEKHNISGYAKNLLDGNVEIIAIGEEEKIELFKNELMKGPVRSRIDRLIEEEYTIDKEIDAFNVF